MRTLSVATIPTSDINITRLNIDLQDFDPHTGVTFICTFFNANDRIIDRGVVAMNGSAWQNWGPSPEEATDEQYVIDFCLSQLGFQRATEET